MLLLEINLIAAVWLAQNEMKILFLFRSFRMQPNWRRDWLSVISSHAFCMIEINEWIEWAIFISEEHNGSEELILRLHMQVVTVFANKECSQEYYLSTMYAGELN